MGRDEGGRDDGVTRRQFLIGGGVALGGLAVAGVVAQRALPLRSYWHQLTGQCGPETPPPEDLAGGEYGTFRSDILGADVEYGHWAPVISYPHGFRFPVCYCLPARGQSPHWVLDAPVHLADYAALKTPGGGIPVIALVAVDGGDTYWHERASGEDRMAMVLDEFIPWYEKRHDVGGSRANRAVMGWSMGGYGALLAAERRPDMFAAVCAASPALWRSYDDGVGDAFDDERDFAENDVFAGIDKLADTAVRVDCGKADVFYDAARDFAGRVEAQTGRTVAGDYSTGCHDAHYWRRVAPDELAFVHRALGPAGRSIEG
jgi:hypothetical protein